MSAVMKIVFVGLLVASVAGCETGSHPDINQDVVTGVLSTSIEGAACGEQQPHIETVESLVKRAREGGAPQCVKLVGLYSERQPGTVLSQTSGVDVSEAIALQINDRQRLELASASGRWLQVIGIAYSCRWFREHGDSALQPIACHAADEVFVSVIAASLVDPMSKHAKSR